MPYTLPAALNKPAVVILPAVALPVALINPAVKILPPVTLPLAVTAPNTLTPVGVNTATLPIVLTDIVTLAFADPIFRLLLPFITFDTLVIMPVNWLPLPIK